MFMVDRQRTLESIRKLGTERCLYSWGGNGWAPTCDCKYGGPVDKPNYMGEQTGCPELRSVYKVLSEMSDDEWDAAVARANGIRI